ncbi:MAG: hypothetical protein R2811_11950 [Flavobacteriales bacterium]
MERERLTRLVRDAAAVDRGDLAELGALAEKFPWFAGAQVLRAVGAQRAGEVSSDDSLRTAAALAPSRTALFDLVHRPVARKADDREPVTMPSEEAQVIVPVAEPVVASGNIVPAPGSQDVVPPEEMSAAAIAAAPDDPAAVEPVAEGAIATTEAVDDISPAEDVPPAEEQRGSGPQALSTSEADPLEQQILESALSHAYDISWLEVEAPKVRKEAAKAPPVDLPTPKPVVPIAPIQPKGAARFVTRHDRLSFTDWLDASTEALRPEPTVQPPKQEFIPEAAEDWLRQPEPKPKASSTPPLAPIQPVLEKKGEVDTKALIDRFIQEQNPASPQKAAFFTPQQAAKRSLDDKAGMVTETLARVYAKQGNLPKAIEAYKRLALKYPEKSAYFAALQKELEAQLNK